MDRKLEEFVKNEFRCFCTETWSYGEDRSEDISHTLKLILDFILKPNNKALNLRIGEEGFSFGAFLWIGYVMQTERGERKVDQFVSSNRNVEIQLEAVNQFHRFWWIGKLA